MPEVEEQVVKHMVLQLEPQAYYTIQIGAYTDAAQGQAQVSQLAQAGYRAVVSSGPPYQLYIGCMQTPPALDALPEAIRTVGKDIFVKKQILNSVQFCLPEHPSSDLQQVAILLASFDIVLKHSLQLFQDYRYEACSEENWDAMITQVQSELQQIAHSAEAYLYDFEEGALAGDLLDLLQVADCYRESLTFVKEKKNTTMVLLAQSCLLELIDAYHTFMVQNRVK